MAGVRPGVYTNKLVQEMNPGDLLLGGENVLAGAIATVGAGTWAGAAIATGIIRRTGPVAGYTDTTDTAANILAALAGNAPASDIVPGSSFRLLFQNTVAQAMTFAAGTGVKTGTGTLDCAASKTREYLLTVLNSSPAVTLPCATTNGNKVITFVLPTGMVALPIGPSPLAVNITPGMTVSGTGITAGTLVLGVTQGVGGITGVTTDTNSTATNASVALTFGPTVQIDALRGGDL